ncbi:MAG TPA: hypothetical protein ENN53_00380 [Candidatus Acetothermia bacterium]|nr:hypothetical protein [Candidatus Acetothermia bacterium]
MKRNIVFLVGVVVGSALSGAGAIGLCDYKPPLTDLTSAWLSGTYRYFDAPTTPGVDVNAGRATANFSRLYDSPGFGYTLSGLGELGFADLALASATASGSGTLRYYFVEGEPVFGFAGLNAGHVLGQPKPALTVSVGGGYGRFADVTPLAKAMRIQTILLGRGQITEALPDATLLAVAAEIGRAIEYAETEDLVAAVVGLIENAAGTSLDPRTVLAVEDEVLATGAERYCGWAIQAGLGYELADPYGGPQDVVVTVSTDAAYAPGPDAQLLLRAVAEGPFDLVNQHTLTANLSYEQGLSATSSLQGSVAYRRVKPLDLDPVDSVSMTVQVAFSLGRATVGVSLGLSRAPGAAEWTKDLSISFAMKLL